MRIQINLNEELLKRVDEEARKIGTSRGAMLTTWIGEKINSLDYSRTMFQQVMDSPIFQEYLGKELARKEKDNLGVKQ